MRIFAIAIIAILISGCQSNIDSNSDHDLAPLSIPRSDASFSQRPKIPSDIEIHKIEQAQAREFLDFFHGVRQRNIEPDERLFRYLKLITRDFNYQENTQPAQLTLETGQGNCLSLAVVTTALARLAGIDVEYQLVDSDPVFAFSEFSVARGVHIRTKLIKPKDESGAREIIFARSGTIIDYFPDGSERFVGNVSHLDYAAKYSNNLAVVALDEQDLDRAYWYAIDAIEKNPMSAEAINLLAVIYRRAGKDDLAEATYRYGIANTHEPLTLLKNYRILLAAQERLTEAAAIQARIDSLDDSSPHSWYLAGIEAYDEGAYKDAITFLKRAENLAPYVHQIQFELSKAYFQMGNHRLAEAHLLKAKEESYKPLIKDLYESKLQALGQLSASTY